MEQDRQGEPFNDGTNRPRIRSGVLISIMIALAAWAILDLQSAVGLSGMAFYREFLSGPLRLLSFCLSVFIAGYLLRVGDRPNINDRNVGSPRPNNGDDAEVEIFKAEGFCLGAYSEGTHALLVELLADLPKYLFRVNEDIRLQAGQLEATTTLHMRLRPPAGGKDADSPPTTILVPVIMARKGLLFDNLVVRDASGRTLPTLSQWETRGLEALVFRHLFGVVVDAEEVAKRQFGMKRWRIGGGARRSEADDEREEIKSIFVEVLIRAICLVGDPKAGREKAVNREAAIKREAALKRLDELAPTMDGERLKRLKALCVSLSENYLIIAEVPVPAGVNLVISYSFQTMGERSLHRAHESRRAKLGLEPYVVDVAMPRAFQADSYHCQISAPVGLHVFSHHLERLGSSVVLKQEDFVLGGVQQYVRLNQQESRVVAHLYIRRQGPGNAADDIADGSRVGGGIKSIVLLRETPPGTLGTAAMLAVLVATVTLFLCAFRYGLNGAPAGPGGAVSLPAFLFAIPAFAAAALGRSIDGNRVARSSLVTYYGLFLVFVVSIFATLLYTIDSMAALPTEVSVHIFGDSLIWRTDWLWIILSALSIALAIFLSRERRDQTAYYLENLQSTSRKHQERASSRLTDI